MAKRPPTRPTTPSRRRGPDSVARRLAELERENRRLAAENRALKAAGKRAAKSGKAEGKAASRAGKSAGKRGAEAIREAARAAKDAGRAAKRAAPGAPPPPAQPPRAAGSGGPLLPGWRRLPGKARNYAGPGGEVLSRRQYDKRVVKAEAPRRPMSEAQLAAAVHGTRDFALFARSYQTRQAKLGVHLNLHDVRNLPAMGEFRREVKPILREIRSLSPGDPERNELIRDLVDLWYEYDMDFEMFKELMDELSP